MNQFEDKCLGSNKDSDCKHYLNLNFVLTLIKNQQEKKKLLVKLMVVGDLVVVVALTGETVVKTVTGAGVVLFMHDIEIHTH